MLTTEQKQISNFDTELKKCVSEKLGSDIIDDEFLSLYKEIHLALHGEPFIPEFVLEKMYICKKCGVEFKARADLNIIFCSMDCAFDSEGEN